MQKMSLGRTQQIDDFNKATLTVSRKIGLHRVGIDSEYSEEQFQGRKRDWSRLLL